MDHHSTLTFVFPEGAKLAKLSLDKYATGLAYTCRFFLRHPV